MRSKTEVTHRNGVRVAITKYPDGRVVDADCQCFGHAFRTHSNSACPNRSSNQKGIQ